MSESVSKKIENNPEVVERASRRRFTLDYKSRIAAEAELCSKPGEPRNESTEEVIINLYERGVGEDKIGSVPIIVES